MSEIIEKQVLINDVNQIIEDQEDSKKRARSTKSKRHHEKALNFWRSIKHHLTDQSAAPKDKEVQGE